MKKREAEMIKRKAEIEKGHFLRVGVVVVCPVHSAALDGNRVPRS